MIDTKSLKFRRREKMKKEYTRDGNILFLKLNDGYKVFVLLFTPFIYVVDIILCVCTS